MGLCLGLVAAPGAGCAGLGAFAAAPAAAERSLAAPAALVWEGVLRALRPVGLREVDPEEGHLSTGWFEGYAERTQGVVFGGGAYRRRLRYDVRIRETAGGTRLQVIAHVEERTPGGPRAFRWERVAPRPEDALEVFSAVEAHLRALAHPSDRHA